MAPAATLSDSGPDGAVVRVEYGVLGPSVEVAEAIAGLLARDHCESLGRTNELIASKRELQGDGIGEYVIYYACERPGEGVPERRRAGPAYTDDLREIALPAIETSHAEARRHRR